MKRTASIKNKLILALDVETAREALDLVDRLKDYVGIFKVGLQLFTSEGPAIIKMIQNKGYEIFYDSKFYDIPNTIARTGEVLTKLGVFMFNVHIAGGYEMMRRTVEVSHEVASKLKVRRPLITGLTILTSIDRKALKEELGIERSMEDQVVHLAKLGERAGLDGVVISPWEIELVRRSCRRDLLIITPGIRPSWAAKDDQKRIMGPAEAIRAGADFIVVGRSITQAPDPMKAARKILEEIEKA